MTTKKRNKQAYLFTKELYEIIKSKKLSDFSQHPLFQEAEPILQDLIFVKAMGFRGVVLTAIVGKYISPKYNPLESFYECNPRSIFEQGIHQALTELKIPCGKSDPLNVAKNTNILNLEWTKGKRPEKAAVAVVNFLTLTEENYGNDNYEYLIELFMFFLKVMADEHNSYLTVKPIIEKNSIQELSQKLWEFTSSAIEGGAIPQFIIGSIIEESFSDNQNIRIEGTTDSVSSTNTTSNKAGDIIIYENSEIIAVIEVTMKKIDSKRLQDSLEVLKSQSIPQDVQLTYICRMPLDIQELTQISEPLKLSQNKKSGYLLSPYFSDFIDIESFIYTHLAILNPKKIISLMGRIQNFIDDYKRPKNTKVIWNKIFSKNKI